MEVTILFANGSTITAEKNGSCFITSRKPSIPEDLSTVTITEDGQQTVLHDAIFVECAAVDKRHWFTFVEEGAEQKTIREQAERIEMLEECILEMSEVVYGE